MKNEILFVRVPLGRATLGAGNWLFDPRSWNVVGDVRFVDEKSWQIGSLPPRAGKTHNSSLDFGSIAELLDYLTRYFGHSVREASPDELPKPDEL